MVPALPAALLLDRGVRIPMLQWWLFPFRLGIHGGQRDTATRIGAALARLGVWRFGLLAATRSRPLGNGTQIAGPFAALVVLLCFGTTRSLPALQRPLAYLGRHLFNVFLFHTFIYSYFWPQLTYAPRSPLAILALLLGVCLGVSWSIERLKVLLRLPRLQAAIDRLRVPDLPVL